MTKNDNMNHQMPRLVQFWDASQLSPHWGAIMYNHDLYSRSIDSPSTISESSSSSFLSTHESSCSFLSTHESTRSTTSGFSKFDPGSQVHVKAIPKEIVDAKMTIETIGSLPSSSILYPLQNDVNNNDENNTNSSEGWISDSISPESSRTSTSSNSQTWEGTPSKNRITDVVNNFHIDPPRKIRTKVRDSCKLSSPTVRDHDSSPFKSTSTHVKETCEALPNIGGLPEKPYLRTKTRCSTPLKALKSPPAYLHGCFRFAEQDGSPCFSFSLKGSNEVFFARASKPKGHCRSNNESKGDCLYIFYCRKDNASNEKGGWVKKIGPKKKLSGDVVSDMVAKMRVCNVKAKSTIEGCISRQDVGSQACFVLFGYARGEIIGGFKSNNDHMLLKDASSSSSSNVSIKSQVQKQVELASIVITTSSLSSSSWLKEGRTITNEDFSRHWSSMIKTHKRGSGEEARERGWGLNFLGNTSDTLIGGTRNCSSPCQIIEKRQLRDLLHTPEEYPWSMRMGTESCGMMSPSGFQKGSKEVRVVVILPSGEHGKPRVNDDKCSNDYDQGSDGPTPLLDRWRSGGDCDCGGWDLGCGLVVLESESRIGLHGGRLSNMMALTSLDLLSWLVSPGHPLTILTQDSKREKVFVLEAMEGGLFSLSFRDQLSPLQAFATAVAIFHEQIKQN